MMGFVGHRIYSQNISITSFTIHNNFLHTFPQFLYFNIVWPGFDQKFKRSMTLKLVIFIQKFLFTLKVMFIEYIKLCFITHSDHREAGKKERRKKFFSSFFISQMTHFPPNITIEILINTWIIVFSFPSCLTWYVCSFSLCLILQLFNFREFRYKQQNSLIESKKIHHKTGYMKMFE